MSPVEAGVTDGTAIPAQGSPSNPAARPTPPSTLADQVVVDGVPIRYAVSGSGKRDVLLVHGYRAHHLWWYRMLPALEERWRVIRLDISGHGDSGHRDRYDVDTWAAELIAVLDAAGSRHALLVGHSMGGGIAAVAGATHPERFGGVVLLDTMLRPPGPRPLPRQRQRSLLPGREIVYGSREEAVTQFRLKPLQPEPQAEVVRPVADYAVRPSTNGRS